MLVVSWCPWCRSGLEGVAAQQRAPGRGGGSLPPGRNKVALRSRRVGEEARHTGACVVEAEEHLFHCSHMAPWPPVSRRPAAGVALPSLNCGRPQKAQNVSWGAPRCTCRGLPAAPPPLPPTGLARCRLAGSLAGSEISFPEFSTKVTPPKRSPRRQEIWTPDPFQLQDKLTNRYTVVFQTLVTNFARTQNMFRFCPWVGMGVRLRGGVGKTGFSLSVRL